MKISLNIPCVMHFNDYQEIRDFVKRVNELTGDKPKLKFTEITSDSDFGYDALFYFNKQDKAYTTVLEEWKKSIKEYEVEM